MTLLGLELSDAGIMAAGDNPPRLLAVDENAHESPGYAIPEKTRLSVGRSAAGKAHLFPLQVNNRFWDQLNTHPLEKKNRHSQNHAEIAFAHLSQIWDNVKAHGNEVIVAVPDYFGREQLGLILGMARELSMPVKGFVPLPVAASVDPRPGAMLLHLDIHMHRFELTYLHQGEDLTREQSLAVQEIGLEQLYRSWVESIAAEFVRTTRFDPLHKASTEQDLYDRLPDVLEIFKTNESFLLEVPHGNHTYRITLLRDLLEQKAAAAYDQIRLFVEKMRVQNGKHDSAAVLQATHRIASLPGLKDRLSEIDDCEIIELEPGSGAMGVLPLGGRLADGHSGQGVSFFTSRPWLREGTETPRLSPHKTHDMPRPTHLLHGNVAYPLSEKPIIIGSDDRRDGQRTTIRIQISGVSEKYCGVRLSGDSIVLTNYSGQGTFVDDERVENTVVLNLGQTIRLGTSGETLRLIACKNTDET